MQSFRRVPIRQFSLGRPVVKTGLPVGIWIFDEITNANPKDTNANFYNSLKYGCAIGTGKKSVFTRTDWSHSIQSNFDLTGLKRANFLHCGAENRNFPFLHMIALSFCIQCWLSSILNFHILKKDICGIVSKQIC